MEKPGLNSHVLRSSSSVWLIGAPCDTICGSKLPSNRQVLCNFFYFHRLQKLTIAISAKETTKQVFKFWEIARIPTRQDYHVVQKVRDLHQQWKNLQKHQQRRNNVQISKETLFCNILDDLFDIAHANAMEIIQIQEDKEFLMAQREKGRRGHMSSADMVLFNQEKRRIEREEKATLRKKKEEERKSNSQAIQLTLTDDSDTEPNVRDPEFVAPIPKAKPKALTSSVVNGNVAGALDRTGVSNRDAMHIIAATASSCGVDIEKTKLSESTIRRYRAAHREEKASEIRSSFNPTVPLTIHWDSKLLPSVTGKEKVDRLAILVSGEGIEKLLGVPEIQSGTGEAQASAVFNMMQDWNLSDMVKSMSFDTTASNTGERQGACALLEKKLQRKLPPLACRHHIHELIVAKVFDKLFGSSSGPKIQLFERFSSSWAEVKDKKFRSCTDDTSIITQLEPVKVEMLSFLQNQLQEIQPRHDYKELIELAILFLGGKPHVRVKIRAPGACHRARWMAKIIYSLKIYLFREQFHLRPKELSSLQEFNVFVVRVYIQHWLQSQSAVFAPYNDLMLIKTLVEYKKVNSVVSTAAFSAFSGHLWYLNETLVGLSFFDSRLPDGLRTELVTALSRKSGDTQQKRVNLKEKEVPQKQLQDFVSEKTRDFFNVLEINQDMFNDHPATWPTNPDFVAAQRRVQQLRVTNDCAERGVALITSFNTIITKQENQKQYLLQVVENHRKKFPSANKSLYT